MSKPVLIGLVNPHSSDSRDDLAPYPRMSSGWRLWQMVHERTQCTPDQYMAAFCRMNLYRRDYDGQDARFGASQVRSILKKLKPGVDVVLLGDDVRKVFGFDRCFLHVQEKDGVFFRQVPHPSGLCRFYNDPVLRSLVAMLLEDLYTKAQEKTPCPRQGAAASRES